MKIVKEYFLRSKRDSNPRYMLLYTRFPGVRLQPLGHYSQKGRRRDSNSLPSVPQTDTLTY